ncbi:GNAT family N-acetyltransferase [Nonomuraea bangladeshensis]|uniref:GNAT family N-acetyltransferase n=1 Tax=Nonomuraea bangladeshensis TaxID=404385 RepID=UPI003C2E012B
MTVRWDDGGTTTVASYRLKVVEAQPYRPPRHIPEPDPTARPDGAAAYFSRPGHPGDAWVRYDGNGNLDGWIRYNRNDPSTTSRYREVFNDPAWRRDVEAMGLREAPPPTPSPARARPPLGDLIPTSQKDVEDRADEIERIIRGEIETRQFAGYGIELDEVRLDYSDESGHGETTIDGSVITNGVPAGMVTRVFHRDHDGTLWAYHDMLFLYPEHQGKGFASAFNKYLEDWYRDSGVERIELLAALDSGGYVWAMKNFTWLDQYEPGQFGEHTDSRVIPRLIDEIVRLEVLLAANRGGTVPDEYRLPDDVLEREQRELDEARAVLERFRLPFTDEQFPHPRDVAIIGWSRSRDRENDPWLGLRVMGNSAWRGVRWLT